jgi:hypothetical protein
MCNVSFVSWYLLPRNLYGLHRKKTIRYSRPQPDRGMSLTKPWNKEDNMERTCMDTDSHTELG